MSGETICLTCGAQLLDHEHLDWCGMKVKERPSPNGENPNAADRALSGPVPIDGARLDGVALLDELHETITGFVVWPSEAASVAYALWIAATHAQEAWEHATRFVAKSPIKRCGKTRLEEVARELAHRPLPAANTSPAALSRSIDESDPPTIFIDEADTIFGRGKNAREGSEDLRGILNAGHSRGWPYLRWDMKANRLDECTTFAMVMLAGIGDMPDTIEDRAVVVSMRRRASGESVRPFRRRRVLPVLHELRDRLHAWMTAGVGELEHAEPELPVEDRDADVWEPLVAVADLAGGPWPERARRACAEMCAVMTEDEGTAGERLLVDLLSIWDTNEEHLPTAVILDRLREIEEAPWSDYFGKPLTARGLAKLLRPYGVKSRNIRIGGDNTVPKGYARDDLADPWHRYATSATALHGAENPDPTRGNGRSGSVAEADSGSATGSDQGKESGCSGVAGVADERVEPATAEPEMF
jgi:hypothetical protein